MKQFEYTKKVLRRNVGLLFPFSLIYAVVIVAIYKYMYNGEPLVFFNSSPISYTVPFVIFTLVISFLFGVFLTLFVAKIREIELKSSGFGFLGLLFGSLAAGCPGCFFGLFPIVLGFFGISGTLAILPFNGLEFQVLTILIMLIGIYFLAKETEISCKV